MKKFCQSLLCLCMIVALFVPFAAGCDFPTTAGGSAKGASDIEVTDPVFGFVPEDEYDPETFDFDTAFKYIELAVDTQYMLFISFDVTARRDNNGQSLLNVDFTFDTLDVLDGTMEDVSTGMIQTMVFTDAVTGVTGKTSTVSFKIPDRSASPKTINIIVRLTPLQAGQSHISIGYRYDPSVSDSPGTSPENYRLVGSDGHTKNINVKKVKIETPVLGMNETLGFLTWKHVKNADYYCIYEEGNAEPLKDADGETTYVRPNDISIGGEMTYNIGSILTGIHLLRIRAFSNNSNILASDFSEILQYTGW